MEREAAMDAEWTEEMETRRASVDCANVDCASVDRAFAVSLLILSTPEFRSSLS